jgi:hypothetical protein
MTSKPVLTYPDLAAPIWRAIKIGVVYVVVLMLTLFTIFG